MPLDLPFVADHRRFVPTITPNWGASSETGVLTDVLLSEPTFLSMVPCNEITRECIASGLITDRAIARRQHREFASKLAALGVRCHFVDPQWTMPDMAFTRDAVLVGPWGLIELRPAAAHRQAETKHVASAIQALGVPFVDQVTDGTVEGGDVCLLRDGIVLIGRSGERTNERGALSLAAIFEARGWKVIHTRFDPRHLHLDTLFTMVDDDCAVACIDELESDLIETLRGLGITLIPVTVDEVTQLGANLLSLGNRRVIAAKGGSRLPSVLEEQGFEVIQADIDQFTRCGGGPHCLTMPLARHPAG
jgi:N-dimethylarginine dimethylaminohydrolase